MAAQLKGTGSTKKVPLLVTIYENSYSADGRVAYPTLQINTTAGDARGNDQMDPFLRNQKDENGRYSKGIKLFADQMTKIAEIAGDNMQASETKNGTKAITYSVTSDVWLRDPVEDLSDKRREEYQAAVSNNETPELKKYWMPVLKSMEQGPALPENVLGKQIENSQAARQAYRDRLEAPKGFEALAEAAVTEKPATKTRARKAPAKKAPEAAAESPELG